MDITPTIEQHTPEDIRHFASKLKITDERATYIESMRGHYIGFEYDYIKRIPDIDEQD
jgi:hypothetical protein